MSTKITSLTIRQRCCVHVSALYALQRRSQAHSYLRQIIRLHKVPLGALDELFLHLSLVLGFPAMLQGFEFMNRVRTTHASRVRYRGSMQAGKRVLRRVYGDQTEKLLRNIKQFHPDIHRMIVREVYGRIYARPGLTLGERELVTLTVLSLQRFDRQVYSHVRGAIRTGVHPRELRSVFRLIEKSTGRSMATPEMILQSVVSSRKKS